ncbi:MAG: HPr(Ser) kinase/phosphatase [Clostridiales bacterium]|nr:HPr(Ser) kinase/phosphatase [Candidatus Cacconaster stercorequi]
MDRVKINPAKLSNLVEEFHLEVLHKGHNYDTCVITISDVNRPALQLVGFYDYFEPKRLQVLGRAEMMYLTTMPFEQRRRVLDHLLSYEMPALIISRKIEVFPEILELAEKHGRTILRADYKTVDLTSKIIGYLSRKLAPQISRHGVLMNIYGQGVLILGDSGVGKSETAIELLKRGHRLVADDAVDIRQVAGALYGSAPEIIRHFIEIRGVGVIDVQKLFGMGAVQFETQIDLVIQLEQWQDGKFYDRLGLDHEKYRIFDIALPYVTIPVRPGRNLAGIVEIATMKNRQMMGGYNPAEDFISRFDQHVDELAAMGSDGEQG